MTPVKAVEYLSSNEYDWKISRNNFRAFSSSSQCNEAYTLLEGLLSDFSNSRNHRVPMAIRWLGDRRAYLS
jgi:hypothetical protein